MLRKKDIILLGTFVLIGIIATILIYLPKKKSGSLVIIRENGTITRELPLTEDTVLPIKNGNHENILHIKNGSVCISDANCNDKSCVSQGRIQYAGECIICLPHKLSIEITGDQKEVDGVSH